jgi:hypothetical protein
MSVSVGEARLEQANGPQPFVPDEASTSDVTSGLPLSRQQGKDVGHAAGS